MYKVVVTQPCRCFFKSGMSELQTFATKEEAQKKAHAMIEAMHKDFCKKHDFVLSATLSGYQISIVPR